MTSFSFPGLLLKSASWQAPPAAEGCSLLLFPLASTSALQPAAFIKAKPQIQFSARCGCQAVMDQSAAGVPVRKIETLLALPSSGLSHADVPHFAPPHRPSSSGERKGTKVLALSPALHQVSRWPSKHETTSIQTSVSSPSHSLPAASNSSSTDISPSHTSAAIALSAASTGSPLALQLKPQADPSWESGVDEVWLRIRQEAREAAVEEPFLASYFYTSILTHPSLERALGSHLANKLSSTTLLATQLKDLFTATLTSSPQIQEAVRADLKACEERDPACLSYVQCILNFKGYQAIQTHRIAHRLWMQGREGLALALANRISEVFHVEIHPAARLGKGILLDHATGVVIGETVSVADNVSLLHRVTLGGTGCSKGLRHPQLGAGVLIGAGAKLLGPITVGAGAKIGACSVVLEDVPAGATVVGNPGKVVVAKGKSASSREVAAPSLTMDQCGFADWVI